MEWKTETAGADGAEVVRIEGDFDLYSSGEFFAAMSGKLEGGARRISFDFSGVSYLDSSGVGAIIKLLQISRRVGGELRFRGVGGAPRKVLRMSNILSLMAEETGEEAL